MKKIFALLLAFSLAAGPAWSACSDTNVKVLLHENNANTDSSSFGRTFTDGSAITYDGSVFKLGTHSATFDGTANGFQTAADAAAYAIGTGDFTISVWAYFTSLPTSGAFRVMLSQYDQNAGGPKAFRISITETSGFSNLKSLSLQTSTNGTSLANTYNSATLTMSTNTWYHFEASRVSGTLYMFQDGVNVNGGGVAMSDNLPDVNQRLLVGASDNGASKNGLFVGKLDEVYFNVGTGLHTAGFTPPATEYCSSTPVGQFAMAICADS